MRDNFERCLSEVLKHEGGWSDHPADPGGATMKGVTLATFRKYRPSATKADLRAISEADLRMIYRGGYWDRIRGDDLPAGLDLVAFDAAVNSGPGRGARWLQSALGVSADGQIGPKTIAAAKAHADRQKVIRTACQDRLRWLQTLGIWATFGKGWARRVAAVEAAALTMAAAGVSTPSSTPSGTGWLAAFLKFIATLLRRSK
ncbi:hypothetical protein M3484_04160 [Pseudomonas sp. GX19020]|uniref:glycoside hydrolase family 108 protein n=1 Tax=Pseudomonas sp. GX19020 TaxID=2942277 RepID=UPI0020197E70|nr:glycosyl hydrolase 108 family protein [Pseudomonas sp. GX19020]MCL4065759.1 hypothetical protein [Pseudomonas sp. GX19020]